MAYQRKYIRDNVRRVMLVLVREGGVVHDVYSEPIDSQKLGPIFLSNGVPDRSKMKRVLKSLVEKGFVEVKDKKHDVLVKITDLGLARAKRYQVEEIHIDLPGWWDRKWRMVMFDVPESHKQERDLFKNKLVDLGFVQLQNSVYVHPAESHNEIEFIRTAYEIKQFVKLLIVDKIEGEATLRKHFGL